MFVLHKPNIVYTVFLITFIAVDGVTVKPVRCPSNKIAPHRTAHSWEKPRTFGYIYNLFSENDAGGAGGGAGNLQEQPQQDDPDDCGDIEDYDENDLSSLYPQRREGNENRFFFNWLGGGNNPQQPEEPQNRPPSTNGPPPFTRPPVNRPPNHTYSPLRPPSGGYFGNNPYSPPYQQYPSDSIKPVHESGTEPSVNYRPGIVGAQVGQVVGVPIRPVRPPPPTPPVNYRPFGEGQVGQELGAPIRPINYPQGSINRPINTQGQFNQGTPIRPINSQGQINLGAPIRPERPTTFRPISGLNPEPTSFPQSYQVTRRPRPRRLNNNSNTVLGSFVDLFFK